VNRVLRITAPCRLHFGLLRFAQAAGLSYGGLGMMIDQPATVIDMQPSDTWQATGPHAERALAFAQQAVRFWSGPGEPPFSIQVRQAPPAHSGLGSGTQLALAVARGVHSLCGRSSSPIDDLSAAVGRGQRSAIGSHGFFHGGLLWEVGRGPQESLTQLTCRIKVPGSWRPHDANLQDASHHHANPCDAGLHGSAEVDAFAQLPPVPPEVTEKLQHLAEAEILPAAEQADFSKFSESLHQYGHLAGSCFAPVQGGPYASANVARCIKKLRSLGLQGVGQSSWGPTVFAFVQDESSGKQWLELLSALPEFGSSAMTLARPSNEGASVQPMGSSDPTGLGRRR